MVAVRGYRNAPVPIWTPGLGADQAEAEAFIRLFHQENPAAGPAEPRLAAVMADIASTGTYTHTLAELTHGARVAWRNSSRCIGRLYWQSLLVRDCRATATPSEIFDAVVQHLVIASGRVQTRTGPSGGQIRPVISIFAPDRPDRPAPRIWNEQLIRYAGYRASDGSVIGDPRNVDFTATVHRLGWQGKGDAFDVLPVVIQTAAGPDVFEIPGNAILEVPLAHPDYAWFGRLGLRWHALPAISHMRLSIGGIDYPLAPFNGWYMGTEIGARNLADTDRYNLLPVIAAHLGLDMSSDTTLWRDRALVEVNRAVLWSFDQAGVRISDHHTESQRFLAHVDREQRAGRGTPADWTWIVPPMSGATTPVFHRYYEEADQRPNFYLDPIATQLCKYGTATEPPVHH